MKKYTLSLALLFLMFISVQAQLNRSVVPKAGPAPKIQIGNSTKSNLPNGLKIYIVEDHRLPKVSFSISLLFNPAVEGVNAGISSLTSSLIGTGTTTLTKDQINEKVDFIGATLDANATGIFASSLKKHTETLLALLADVTMNSVFSKEELEKKRNQMISGIISNKDNAENIAEHISSAAFYGKAHPYGEFETEASVKNVTLEMCTQYYQTYFRPNIACISVVGDITPAEAEKLIKKFFINWKPAAVPTKTYDTPQPPQKSKVILVDRPQSVQSVITIGYPIPLNLGNPDYIKARVMNTILGGGTFRLFNNLREKHAYTYGAYSGFNYYPLISNFYASASVRNAVTDSSITQILFEMKRLREEKVTPEELKMVQNYLTGNFALSLENPQTIAAFAINTERYHLPADFYTNYLKNIAAVTVDDITAMSKKYLLPDQSYIVVVGKASEITKGLSKFSENGILTYEDIDANIYDPNATGKAIPSGITAQTVLENYIKSIGGLEKIKNIQDFTMKGSINYQGMPLILSIIYKNTGKFVSDLTMNGQSVQKQLLNGKIAKSSGMQGSEDLTGVELEKLKLEAQPVPEIVYQQEGYTVTLKAITPIDSKDAYVIELKSPTGNISTDYYDIETGLKVRSVSEINGPTGKTMQTTDILSYKETNGLKFPDSMKQTIGAQSFNIQVDSIQINTQVKDEVFN